MKLTCSRNNLMEALNTVQRSVAVRSTNPVLDGILMTADQSLILTGYDNETGIEYRMDADISNKGSIVVPAKIMLDVVRSLPDNNVYLEVKEDTVLLVESGKSVFHIRGYASERYPEIHFIEDKVKIEIEQKKLKQMINQTIFSVSSDLGRPILMGLNLVCRDGTMTLVALDGFRLAVRHQTINGLAENINIIIPAKAMGEIARILKDSDDKVTISPSHNYVIFTCSNVKVVTRLIKGEFLDYKTIIPRDAETSLIIAPDVLLAAVERASIMIETDDRRFPVTFYCEDKDVMRVTSKTDIGTAREEIPVALSGEPVEIDFNPRFFIEVLRQITDERVLITFNGSLGPCSIRPENGDDFYYLVLPLRR
ncbi:MAG: DNA polymerase III subunit beta [Saccharofermentanales bacterium]|jgi:DNA polymerase-3 subunit beta